MGRSHSFACLILQGSGKCYHEANKTAFKDLVQCFSRKGTREKESFSMGQFLSCFFEGCLKRRRS